MIEIDGEFFKEPINNIFEIYFASFSYDEAIYNTMLKALKDCKAFIDNKQPINIKHESGIVPPKPGQESLLVKNVMPDEFLNWIV